MALLDDVKLQLRQSENDLDGEIIDLIEAAKSDLALSGIIKTDDTDPLYKRAITLYCKTNFGYDNPDAEKFQNSYDMLKSHLSLSVDYTGVVV